MGIATFLIAFVPTYQVIGIWGAVILTVLRMVQGIGVGGEWGGSVLLAMEWSRHHGQRGLVASWPQFGVPCGLFLSNLSILAFSTWSGDEFAIWGWRIPFALSIILVGDAYARFAFLPFMRSLAETAGAMKVADGFEPGAVIVRGHPHYFLLQERESHGPG